MFDGQQFYQYKNWFLLKNYRKLIHNKQLMVPIILITKMLIYKQVIPIFGIISYYLIYLYLNLDYMILYIFILGMDQQQNPWKKQMMMNRANRTSKVATQIPKAPEKPVESQSSNPWKNQIKTQEQPSWVKPNNETTTPSNKPSWVKNNNDSPQNSQPSWVKKPSEVSNSQPSWAKNQQNIGSSSQPSWVKKTEVQIPSVSTNPWKQQTQTQNNSTFQTPWQKKAREQRQQKQRLERQKKEKQELELLQKQKEEQERIKRQQEQRKMQQQRKIQQQRKKIQQQLQRKRKIEQQISIEREIKQMSIQDKLSSAREQQDQENQRKNQKKKPKKKQMSGSKKKVKNNSPINIFKEQANTTLGLYLKFLQLSTSKMEQYQDRITYQKQLLKCVDLFVKQSSSRIIQHVNNKKIQAKKKNFITFEDMEMKYVLAQTNQETQDHFNNQCLENIRIQFYGYQLLSDAITSLMKKNATYKLRAPLLCLISYKGIQFICESVNQQLSEVIASDRSNFNEIYAQLNQLQQQLKDNFDFQLDKSKLLIKKLSLVKQEVYILYFKESATEEFRKLFDSKQKIESQNLLDSNYFQKKMLLLPNQNELKYLIKTNGQAVRYQINNIRLAKSILAVYNCGQAEISEQSFFRMIIEKRPQIWKMIKQASKLQQQFSELQWSSICFRIIQCVSGLKFNFSKAILGKSSKYSVVRSVEPLVYNYEFKNLEIKQSQVYFNKCLIEGRIQLAKQALNLQKQYLTFLQYPQSSQQIYQLKLNQANLYKHQNQPHKSLQVLKQIHDLLTSDKKHKYDIRLISILIMKISLYISLDIEDCILLCLKQLIEILQFYYKEETPTHSTIYSLLGRYYSTKENRLKQSDKFYELALGIALKLYGNKSLFIADIYLSRSKHYLMHSKHPEALKDLNIANQIYKTSSKNSLRTADALCVQAEIFLSEKNMEQYKQCLNNAKEIFLKFNRSLEALEIFQQMLANCSSQEQQEEIQEQICYISIKFKHPKKLKDAITKMIQKQLKAYPRIKPDIFNELIDLPTIHIQQTQQTSQQPQQRPQQTIQQLAERNRQIAENMVELEKVFKDFGSFTQILLWALGIICGRNDGSDYDRASDFMYRILSLFKWKQELEAIFI